MIELLTPDDTVVLFGMITATAALALIIFELINFIPSLMLSTLNRMRNKTLAHEADSLTGMDIQTSLDTKNMDTDLDSKKSLSEHDLFKRFKP